MVLLSKRRVLAMKAEGTPGTAEALAAADAVYNAFDTAVNPDIEYQERPGQSALSPLAGAVAGRKGRVTFALELAQSALIGVPLLACGMQVTSDVYTPNSASTATITIGVYEDGLFKRLRGCMGTCALVLRVGAVGRVEFDFQGIWDAPTDVALLAPNYPSYVPPRFAGDTFSYASWGPKISECRIDLNNEITLREDPTDASGYIAAHVTGRRITASIDPETPLVATKDIWGMLLAITSGALAVTVGLSGGEQISIDAPAVTITNLKEADRNGLAIERLDLQFNRSADAGDDEISIDLSP